MLDIKHWNLSEYLIAHELSKQAICYYEAGNLSKSLQCAFESLKKYKFSHLPYFIIGECANHTLDYKRAITALTLANFIKYNYSCNYKNNNETKNTDIIELLLLEMQQGGNYQYTYCTLINMTNLPDSLLIEANDDILISFLRKMYNGFIPSGIMVQISQRCNLNCTFCGHTAWRANDGIMSIDTFNRVISELNTCGIDNITLVGPQGDPLINPNATDMCEYAVANNLKVTLVSNGNPLNAEKSRRLANAGLKTIGISFGGYDKQSYETNYVGGNFEKISHNLKVLSDELLRSGKEIEFYTTGIYSKAVKDLCTFQDFAFRTYDYLLGLGIRNVRVSVTADPHNFAGTVAAGEYYSELDVFSTQNLYNRKITMCEHLVNSPGILFDGRVTACGCLDANCLLYMGNITENKLENIFSIDKCVQYYKYFLSNGLSENPLCKKCDIPFRKEHNSIHFTIE